MLRCYSVICLCFRGLSVLMGMIDSPQTDALTLFWVQTLRSSWKLSWRPYLPKLIILTPPFSFYLPRCEGCVEVIPELQPTQKAFRFSGISPNHVLCQASPPSSVWEENTAVCVQHVFCMYPVARRGDAGLGFVDWHLQSCCGTQHGYEWVSTADGLFTFNHYWDCFTEEAQHPVTCLLSRISAEFTRKPHFLWYHSLLVALVLLSSI